MAAKLWAVVPAAGAGRRFGVETPKQYLPLLDKTVFEHSLGVLFGIAELAKIVVALSADDAYFDSLVIANSDRLLKVNGGAERADSVLAGLQGLNGLAADDDWVLVHDAARPCVSAEEMNRLLALRDGSNGIGGLLALPVVDTLKRVDDHYKVVNTVDRNALWRALTPQLFRFAELKQALEYCLARGLPVTDEASAIEQFGKQAKVVLGNARNIKITYPQDLALAAHFLSLQQAEESAL
ncbi:2-C-methyl-D-erythritol 4-phosphate cytidylyltransferase [Spongiibacter sp. KMU-158]|uniref:2-C-methyl-D-erythritol 4-phosphate cytidylyltransferase n=1 Tax=Spongiibacter pelagi TaxID=2760804 RepID=A0A927C555_9GAMM|nr:2-C-methyl-D-erythritol 4-phosphate cytidylyltransferase [Spongiibacter pelagi]MBD2859941.1 2-C-methyl-D-erythritol 4-phosphate cytidylyltransferase [Spongiibacter pelagi]